jgi:hypothetical protein
MQSFVTVEDRAPYVQHGLDHRRKYGSVLDQLADPFLVAPAADGSDSKP